jgi:hypothetical protein
VQVYLLSPFVHVDGPPQSTSSHSLMSAHAVSLPDGSSPAARVVPAAHAVHAWLLTCSSVSHVGTAAVITVSEPALLLVPVTHACVTREVDWQTGCRPLRAVPVGCWLKYTSDPCT